MKPRKMNLNNEKYGKQGKKKTWERDPLLISPGKKEGRGG